MLRCKHSVIIHVSDGGTLFKVGAWPLGTRALSYNIGKFWVTILGQPVNKLKGQAYPSKKSGAYRAYSIGPFGPLSHHRWYMPFNVCIPVIHSKYSKTPCIVWDGRSTVLGKINGFCTKRNISSTNSRKRTKKFRLLNECVVMEKIGERFFEQRPVHTSIFFSMFNCELLLFCSMRKFDSRFSTDLGVIFACIAALC